MPVHTMGHCHRYNAGVNKAKRKKVIILLRPYLKSEFCYSFDDEKRKSVLGKESPEPDPKKEIILDYLNENCVAVCPGIAYDVFDSKKVSGCGNIFCDDKYFWDDSFIYYFENYNIPFPNEFRRHILENYNKRKHRHTECRLLDSVKLFINPFAGFRYTATVNKNGVVEYQDNSRHFIKLTDKENALYIIRTVFSQLFCYDVQERGELCIDGFCWKAEFFIKDKSVYKTDGACGEPKWRTEELYEIVEFIERVTGLYLGSELLKRSLRNDG